MVGKTEILSSTLENESCFSKKEMMITDLLTWRILKKLKIQTAAFEQSLRNLWMSRNYRRRKNKFQSDQMAQATIVVKYNNITIKTALKC